MGWMKHAQWKWMAAALAACLGVWTPVLASEGGGGGNAPLDPREVHLADLQQLTFGGENAEAYWSPDGGELIFQSTRPPFACDQIFRLAVPGAGEAPAEPRRVSTGEGRTTCAYFTADGESILYASTHAGGPDCPPPPDRSMGYAWALYDTYEIYRAELDGSNPVALTDNRAYDAEATVCPLDGSILFTSTRDGDPELYRMDADGGNLLRLTEAEGYDGGGFFSADCSKIVWRASRPRGEKLEEFRQLLARGLVRPGKLELWVADADGTDARQITYLDAASFAPYFFPSGERVIFSSNYGDPRGREFDLWAVDIDGTDLERVTFTPEFDGFPMFSPDGRHLAFASNRGHKEAGETNVFVARWVDAGPVAEALVPLPADRYRADVAWLAADERDGRGIGTEGLGEAARWLAARFAELGLEPAGDGGTYLQSFPVPVEVTVGEGTALRLDGAAVAADAFQPASFSASAGAAGEVVAVGYGITAPELEIDDYAGLDVAGKVVVARRFTPPAEAFEDEEAERRYSDLRYKAFNAREHGAAGLLVVDLPLLAEGEEMPDEAPLGAPRVDGKGDAGIPVVLLSRQAGAPLFEGAHRAELAVELEIETEPAANVVGRLAAPEGRGAGRPPVVIGAHYDHLGLGGSGSLAPDVTAPHNGADDNASGTAALLEAARHLTSGGGEGQKRDIYLVAFAGEERGLLGSTHFTRHPPAGLAVGEAAAMINMDMVGRLRDNRLSVLGSDSAGEWNEMVDGACAELRLGCALGGGDGYGPSDQTPFYAAGVPVLHLFSGVHDDYHRPSDDVGKINAAGGARVAALAAELARRVAGRGEPLTYLAVPEPPPKGDFRGSGARLGTVPDYTGPADGRPGVLLAGVRPGSPAEAGGMRRGDLLVELAGREIRDIQDFMFVLRAAKPGDTATAVVERDGRRVELAVTFGVSRGMQ